MDEKTGRCLAVRTVVSLAVLLLPLHALALPPELWVVNEGTRDISIIDSILDTPATIETIPLGGPQDPAPYGIAFSTVEGMPGAHAFVGQGPEIKVIDFPTRNVVAACDVGAWLGVAEITLKGMDAARPERFEDGPGIWVTRSLLHVAAEVRPTAGEDPIPWYLVLDQHVLTDVAAPCQNALVADGPLAFPSTAPMEAMEVAVLGSPEGPRTQRAWYTFRELGSPPVMSARLVVGGPSVVTPWAALETVSIPSPAGIPVPDSVHPASPRSRELPLLPDPANGELLRLDTGDRCGLGDIPRATAVTGPGFGSYSIWTAKSNAAGPPDLLQRSGWDMCPADPPLEIGDNPVDVEVLGRVEWEEVYVANHDSDTISVVQAADPGLVIPILLADSPLDCVKCPRSLAVQETPESICRAVDHEMELINGDTEIFHTWNGVGCQDNEFFKVWCRCLSHDPLECPSDCRPPLPPGGGRPGEVWVEVDVVAGSGNNGGTATTANNGNANTETNIEASGS